MAASKRMDELEGIVSKTSTMEKSYVTSFRVIEIVFHNAEAQLSGPAPNAAAANSSEMTISSGASKTRVTSPASSGKLNMLNRYALRQEVGANLVPKLHILNARDVWAGA